MDLQSDHIPKSLQTYVERYRVAPKEAIRRLETHIEKRGNDAVGYYLLSWFYHHANQREMAVKSAWKAKIYAPGSPVMEKLHYYMQHPETFRAWNPENSSNKRDTGSNIAGQGYPIHDLDSLIERLSSLDSGRIRIDPNTPESETPDLSSHSESVDDIVTETLASIHEKQGNYREAIRTFQHLTEAEPERKEHFKKEIRRLQARIEEKKSQG